MFHPLDVFLRKQQSPSYNGQLIFPYGRQLKEALSNAKRNSSADIKLAE